MNKKSPQYLAKRAARRKAAQEAQKRDPIPSEKSLKEYPRWIRVAKLIVGSLVVAGAGFVASVYQIEGGPPWPTALVFSPGPPAFASSAFDVPFDVENKSVLFGFSNLKFACKIVSAAGQSSSGNKFSIIDSVVAINATNKMGPSNHGVYMCPFRIMLSLGNNENAAERVSAVKISFLTEYDRRIFWGRSHDEDGPFTLVMTTARPHWVRGEILK